MLSIGYKDLLYRSVKSTHKEQYRSGGYGDSAFGTDYVKVVEDTPILSAAEM